MGIPGFFGWMRRSFKGVVSQQRRPCRTHALYLDMNALIHPCCATAPDETTGFQNLGEAMHRLCKQVEPTKLLYLAVDGVAPKAKMVHQRGRRFLSALEGKKREETTEGKTASWDRNQITPGTPYMERLNKYLKHWCHQFSLSQEEGGCTVVLSDAAVPGEGEHKILRYLRKYGSRFGPQAFYSPDADVILLALASRLPQITVLRHDHFRPKVLYHVSIDTLRDLVLLRYSGRQTGKFSTRGWWSDAVLDDWIVLTFLGGNDFLPALNEINIGKHGLNPWLTRHVRFVQTFGKTLVQNRSLHLPTFQKYLQFELEAFEEEAETFSGPDLGEPPKALDPQGQDQVQLYWKGLEFVTLYYLQGCPSWTWYYPFHRAPLLRSLVTCQVPTPTEFQLGRPFLPLEQLLSVLPPASSETCLPPAFAQAFEELKEFCPAQFPILHDKGRPDWQVTPVLPQIPTSLVREKVRQRLDNLTEVERKRNRLEEHGYKWRPPTKRARRSQ